MVPEAVKAPLTGAPRAAGSRRSFPGRHSSPQPGPFVRVPLWPQFPHLSESLGLVPEEPGASVSLPNGRGGPWFPLAGALWPGCPREQRLRDPALPKTSARCPHLRGGALSASAARLELNNRVTPVTNRLCPFCGRMGRPLLGQKRRVQRLVLGLHKIPLPPEVASTGHRRSFLAAPEEMRRQVKGVGGGWLPQAHTRDAQRSVSAAAGGQGSPAKPRPARSPVRLQASVRGRPQVQSVCVQACRSHSPPGRGCPRLCFPLREKGLDAPSAAVV